MTARRIIRSYYLIAGIYTLAAAVIWGVNTLFLLDAGLDILGVFLVNAAYTAGMVVFEIPTGVLADTRGRRASFLLSVATLFASTLGYVLVARAGGGLLPFALVSVLIGLGFTFYSGAVEAWLVDALKEVGHDGELDSVFARGAMVTGSAMLVGTLGGGLLGSLHLSLPYLVRAGLLAVVLLVAALTMHDLGFTPRTLRLAELPAEMRGVARVGLTYGWRRPSVLLLMLASCVQYGFLSWGFYAWQPYFLDLLGSQAVWVAGGVAALISLSTILGNTVVDLFSRFCGKRTTLLLWGAAVQTAAAVGVGLAGSFWLAATMLLLVTFAMGLSGPVRQAYLHQVVPSAQRATVLSFDSMFGNLGGVFGQSGLGWVARSRSIADGFVLGGSATLLALPFLVALRRLGEPADRIIGKRCGVQAPCAAQGLPEINLVDATRRQAAPSS